MRIKKCALESVMRNEFFAVSFDRLLDKCELEFVESLHQGIFVVRSVELGFSEGTRDLNKPVAFNVGPALENGRARDFSAFSHLLLCEFLILGIYQKVEDAHVRAVSEKLAQQGLFFHVFLCGFDVYKILLSKYKFMDYADG